MVIGNEATASHVCPDCNCPLALEVLRSAAGFYLGTLCPDDGPVSRESDYFRTGDAAAAEMEIWATYGVRPHARTPGYWQN